MGKYFSKDSELVSTKQRMVRAYARFPYMSPQYRHLVARCPAEASILDVGAGEGTFLQTARHLRPSAQLFAVDIDNYLDRDVLTETVNFQACDLSRESLPYADATFDYVNCSHVLEHVPNPIDVLKQISRVLKPGGILYLETPDTRWASLPRIPLLTSDSGTYNFWDDPTHLRRYSRPSLRKGVEMAGLNSLTTFRARKWLHLGALPLAVFSRRNDYKVAVLQALLGIWCGVLAEKPKS